MGVEGGDVRTSIPTVYGDWIKRFGETWNTQVKQLKDVFGTAIEEVLMPGEAKTDVPIVIVKRDQIIHVLKFLKEDWPETIAPSTASRTLLADHGYFGVPGEPGALVMYLLDYNQSDSALEMSPPSTSGMSTSQRMSSGCSRRAMASTLSGELVVSTS